MQPIADRPNLRAATIPRLALRRDEAAASLGISVTTFDKWVAAGRMPRPKRIDGVTLWDRASVEAAWHRLGDSEEVDRPNPFDEVVA